MGTPRLPRSSSVTCVMRTTTPLMTPLWLPVIAKEILAIFTCSVFKNGNLWNKCIVFLDSVFRYHSSTHSAHSQVIRTTGSGATACKICGSPYKTVFRNHEGVKLSLLEVDTRGPYVSFVVVTRHDTSPGLFNTKFRLNFASQGHVNLAMNNDHESTEITIGRSSACNMVLDYRTVSTTHAKMSLKVCL